jgi:serine/threonine protein kinase
MKFETGKTYGGYEFLDPLGSAKTVMAFRVRNVAEKRTELLRILPDPSAGDLERQQRFLREIKVRARLVHPNIVTFYHAGELEGQLVMTTELVEGSTLAERLELGPLVWHEAVGIMTQVLHALTCAHSHGVVHREVTPANIILVPDKTVKLSGFGLARAATDAQLTQAGTMLGELKYMAPEQVKGLATLDGRSDIYSAGAVLYEAVTGAAPFDSKSQFDLMLAQVTAMPQPPSKLRLDVPARLDALILKAMAKDPAQRYQSADEFREALERPAETLEEILEPIAETPTRSAMVIPIASGSRAPAPLPTPIVRPMPGDSSGGAISVQVASWRWGSVELALAGVFMFIVAMVAFLAFLTMRS